MSLRTGTAHVPLLGERRQPGVFCYGQTTQARRSLAASLIASDDQLLSFKEWCRLNTISERAGRRIWADPKARPILTKLTSKKHAVSVGNNRRWQQARAV